MQHLVGHSAKIYALGVSAGAGLHEQVVSASQDGRILVWQGRTGRKLKSIRLVSSWVMAVAYSGTGALVASGGLDNTVTLHSTAEGAPGAAAAPLTEPSPVLRRLQDHEGYISGCTWVGRDDRQLLSASGDKTCKLWDVSAGAVTSTFAGHSEDVSSLQMRPGDDTNIFVTCSVDQTARVWDVRTGGAVQTHELPSADMNSVKWHPGGSAFAVAGDDGGLHLLDYRSYNPLGVFNDEAVVACAACLDFSKAGRYVFGGYDDFNIVAWDVLSGKRVGEMQGHTNRVSELMLSTDGNALFSSSWDKSVNVYTWVDKTGR